MYKRMTQEWMEHLDFILWDVLSLQLAFASAYFIRHGIQELPYSNEIYRDIAIMLTLIDILVAIVFDTMHNVLKRGYYIELANTAKHAAIVFGILTIYLFSTQKSDILSRITLFLTLGLHIIIGYGIRLFWKAYLMRKNRVKRVHSLILVTEEALAREVINQLRGAANATFRISGLVLYDRDATGETIEDISVVAGVTDFANYICREWVDEVFILADNATEKTVGLIEQCHEMGVVVHECISCAKTGNLKQFIERIDGYTVLTTTINYATPMQALIKRCMDILGGTVGCLLSLFIVAFIGPRIKKASPGPIFFKQTRIGKNGRKFTFVKLRSMYMDAEERKQEYLKENRVTDGMMFKLDFDPRVIGNEILPDGTKKTGIGDFIRRTSLDEFPQFWNVLKGDMSLVGTRPPTVDEWEKYKLHHRARMAIKPGLTGMWQISGRSNITDFEEVVKLDTDYINNWSMGLDCRILVKTVGNIVTHDGAM